ncbi:hypothetical protein [Actinomadura oligospora]|nr:hypothetical protein [Actinomadura oligospora]
MRAFGQRDESSERRYWRFRTRLELAKAAVWAAIEWLKYGSWGPWL